MSINREAHLKNREWMAATLAREIFGPGGHFEHWKNDLYGPSEEISVGPDTVFPSWEEYNRKRHVQKNTGEEILKDEQPAKRYGVGLLYPDEGESTDDKEGGLSEDDAATEAAAGIIEEGADKSPAAAKERANARKTLSRGARIAQAANPEDAIAGEDNEVDALRLARLKRPRSMGISFIADGEAGPLKIEVQGGRYRPVIVKIKGKEGAKDPERKLWLRVPVKADYILDLADAGKGFRHSLNLEPADVAGLLPLVLQLDIQIRPVPTRFVGYPPAARLVTATLLNNTQHRAKGVDEGILFQARFSITSAARNARALLSLPQPPRTTDDEEESLRLLYRNTKAFAVGHGCAGDWEAAEGASYADRVIAEPIPVHQTPPVTPHLYYPKGHPKAGRTLEISMRSIATDEPGWLESLRELAELYEAWIEEKESEISTLDQVLHKVARRHMDTARACLLRIRKGLKLLKENDEAAFAFRLANEAVLLQQLAGRQEVRKIQFQKAKEGQAARWIWSREVNFPAIDHEQAAGCTWRPFQIAFLLMSLCGLWDGSDDDRKIADLIWFPTGGGKTEAYLGATAFHLLARRLQDSDDSGTGVLMRYTLRLLTSQQFQRASGLICSLEQIRKRRSDKLGESPFSIGIWVGAGTTPNSRRDSVEAYYEACEKGPDAYEHVLLRCPWCGTEMGPKPNFSKEKRKFTCHGLALTGAGDSRTVRIHCPERLCGFYKGLPVLVVDEEIYESPPSVVIGTVDKFAMLAWRHDARAIFGIDENGRHSVSPPGLIIQDELHLITGPLGSMVGLYEGVIDELCTWRSKTSDKIIRPKLVASTATTRASTRQIRDLYAREHTAVFPPPGLDSGDSFFATYDRDETRKIKPGRMYLGVLARAYGSALTVNVRVFSSLLAAARLVDPKERDPWHTLLVFYNALRELGADLTLFGADIPERLAEVRNRWTPGAERRYLNYILELTGRLENSEVPRALEALERKFGSSKWDTVDACLASNIIEVGVDVPRLGLMAVSGQPKNTAQYIQATGRVGRELPGLVVTVYNNRKSRDLSHYEHFRDYHGRLYAQVEPASVTPFTTQVLERALHGAFVAWVRNKVPVDEQRDPRKFLDKEGAMRASMKEFFETFKGRIAFLLAEDSEARDQALELFKKMMNRRGAEWEAWTRGGANPCAVQWQNKDRTGTSADQPLLRRYGESCRDAWRPFTWPTPTSMRGVDAECPAEIITGIPELDAESSSIFD